MSAVGWRTASDLLCGPITSPLLEYSVVVLVHGVSYQNVSYGQDCKISVQIARVNEELPLLKTKTISLEQCIFEEVLVVHTETLEDLELLLCTTHEVVDEYELKVGQLAPFVYHHVTLAGQWSQLFVTLVVKTKCVPPSLSPHVDVQVLVQHLETPLENPREAVIVLAKENYEDGYSQIKFNSKDKVQISVPQGPSDQPQWYHSFLCRSCSPSQRLALLLFHQPFISSQTQQWSLGDKIGECVVPLDNKLASILTRNPEGVSFTNVALKGIQSDLSLRIAIRLGASPALTPSTIPEYTLRWDEIPEPKLRIPAEDPAPAAIPVHDACSSTGQSATKAEGEGIVLPDHSAILQLLQRHSTPQTEKGKGAEQLNKLIETQSAELQKYRDAVQKMGKDIVSCRDYIVSLRQQNEALEARLSELQQIPHDVSLSNIPKDDLVREVVRVRKVIRTESERSDELTQTLQTMRLNLTGFEKERKELRELRHAHTAQNQLLQKLQEKVKITRVLEKTCKDQEKVIERLEAMLNSKSNTNKHKEVMFNERLALLPPQSFQSALALPKLEPCASGIDQSDSYEDIPMETSLKLRVRALENQLRASQHAHQEEMSRLAGDKMDLQLKLARLRM